MPAEDNSNSNSNNNNNNKKPFRLFKDFQVGMTSEQIANTRVYVSRAWAGAIMFSLIGLGLGLLSQKFKKIDKPELNSDKKENLSIKNN